jgi:cell division protein ZapA (FtsZ GTPase activity inhibitor)
MDHKQVTVNILGTSFAVRADEDPEYVTSLVRYISEKVDEIGKNSPVKDPLRQSILAAMLITDELFKERKLRGESHEVAEITNRIIKVLDQSLEK